MQVSELLSAISSHCQTAYSENRIPIIVIIGPTASGKTALSIELAKILQGEVVSADSRQIYQEMNIGTGKVTPEQMQGVKHHMLDLVRPDQEFSLAHYQKMANHYLEYIDRCGRLPFLVGGTGLYISSIVSEYRLPEAEPDLELRAELEQYALEKGSEALHEVLKKLNPEAADRIHHNNQRYVIRAIEIAVAKSKSPDRKAKTDKYETPTSNIAETPKPFSPFFIGIDWPREELYALIDRRVDQQIEAGLLAETQNLIAKYSLDLPSMSSLGYREIALYLNGQITLEEAVETFKRLTRNYAKRQLTWFRKYDNVNWLPGSLFPDMLIELRKLKPLNLNQLKKS